MFRAIGAIVSQARLPLKADNSPESVAQCLATLTFAELRWTGTDQLASDASSAATALVVVDASKYTVGSYVKFPSDDNGGAGYQVTAVNIGTNTLTITPGLGGAQSTGAQVQPWFPVSYSLGTPVHGRLGLATRAAVNLPMLSAEITLDNMIKLLNEEKNGLEIANRFLHRDRRDIRYQADIYFDAAVAKYWSESDRQIRADMVLPWGNTAANRVALNLKNVELNRPLLSGAEEKIERIEGQSFASTSFDDEANMLFD